MNDANGKSTFPDFFGSTRIFHGDGDHDNSNAIRILRKHVNGFFLVIKVFNFLHRNKEKLFFTLKFHRGDINKMFRLEESWNMKERTKMSFSERLDYLDVFDECLLSWRRNSSRFRNSFKISDLYHSLQSEFFSKNCRLFTDNNGKFRFILTIKSKVSLVIKFSLIHKELIFTAKYRFEKADEFAKFYNMDEYSKTVNSKTGYSPAYSMYYNELKDILCDIFMQINMFNNDIIGTNNDNKYQKIGSK